MPESKDKSLNVVNGFVVTRALFMWKTLDGRWKYFLIRDCQKLFKKLEKIKPRKLYHSVIVYFQIERMEHIYISVVESHELGLHTIFTATFEHKKVSLTHFAASSLEKGISD